ncbi:hypothetical protein D3C85_1564280 [compost metagenome]
MQQPIAHGLGCAGAHQPLTDHEQAGDQDQVGVGEACDRLSIGDRSAQGQHHDHHQRDRVRAGPADQEEHDRDAK